MKKKIKNDQQHRRLEANVETSGVQVEQVEEEVGVMTRCSHECKQK